MKWLTSIGKKGCMKEYAAEIQNSPYRRGKTPVLRFTHGSRRLRTSPSKVPVDRTTEIFLPHWHLLYLLMPCWGFWMHFDISDGADDMLLPALICLIFSYCFHPDANWCIWQTKKSPIVTSVKHNKTSYSKCWTMQLFFYLHIYTVEKRR